MRSRHFGVMLGLDPGIPVQLVPERKQRHCRDKPGNDD